MATPYVTKTQAVILVSIETGRGRRIIETIVDKLTQEGRITIERDPIDTRALRISRADVDKVVAYIKNGGD